MTADEEIAALKARMHLMEQNILRLARLVAILTGVPETDLDEACKDELAKWLGEGDAATT